VPHVEREGRNLNDNKRGGKSGGLFHHFCCAWRGTESNLEGGRGKRFICRGGGKKSYNIDRIINCKNVFLEGSGSS